MFLSKVQELHYHSQKPFVIKCLFSIILSVILFVLFQPKWCFTFKKEKDEIVTEIIPIRILVGIIIVSIILYFVCF